MPLFYADASALVKFVLEEPESAALRAFAAGAELVSSELVLTELPRAVRRAAAAHPRLGLQAFLELAGDVLETVALRPLDRDLLLMAGGFDEPGLRALDAVHVAAGVELSPLDAFVTYDERQGAAARLAGLRTVAPRRADES